MQFKLLAATLLSLTFSGALAGPIAQPNPLDSNAFLGPAAKARAAKLMEHGVQGTLTAQQRLDAAHAAHPDVKQWNAYWWDEDLFYPGTYAYDFDYAYGLGLFLWL